MLGLLVNCNYWAERSILLITMILNSNIIRCLLYRESCISSSYVFLTLKYILICKMLQIHLYNQNQSLCDIFLCNHKQMIECVQSLIDINICE